MTTRSENSCRLGIRSLVMTAALLAGTGVADAQRVPPPVEPTGEETPALPSAVTPAQCPSQVILAGVIDKPPFSTANGAELAAPSATLLQATVGPLADFDGTAPNKRFVHTFRLPPCKCLVGAKLEFRAKPLGSCGPSSPSNDSLTLGFSTLFGFPRWFAYLGSGGGAPFLSTPAWCAPTLVRTFTLDLAALPTTGGPLPGSPPFISLLSAMQTNKYLDFYVQDDTAIDYLKLTATMCDCCQPNGRAEICISKFDDKNGNGVKNTLTEPGLQGWTFQANDQAGGNLVTSPPTTATGTICFSVLAPATYTISEVPKPGWTQTTPAGPAVVTVAPGGPAVNLVFGNWRKSDYSDSR